MKFFLADQHHETSPAFSALINQRIEALRADLQIDEAHVLVERRPEASPAFRITAHLVTPGPDVFADAVDHTLRAALEKMIGQLAERIDHRQQKRAQRTPGPQRKTPTKQLASTGARK